MSGTIVIGVGNALRGDDAAGLRVAQLLAERGLDNVRESSGEIASLIDLWQGADFALLVDAAQSGAEPGFISRFDVSTEPLPVEFLHCSTHAFGVAEAVELARALETLPPRVIVFGIEGISFEHGAILSPEVAAGVEQAAAMIETELSHA
jgi:hydrogenase maturation protease